MARLRAGPLQVALGEQSGPPTTGTEPVFLSLALGAAVVGMIVAFLVWLHRDRPGAPPLATFVVAASLWSMAEGLELAAASVGPMRTLAQVELILSTVIPLAWLVTVLDYTGRESWLSRRRLAALLVEPLVFTVLVVTAGGHALVWQAQGTASLGATNAFAPTYGVAFWGHLAYSLAVVAVGGVLLTRLLVRSNRLHRWQSTALLGSIAVPMIVHTLFVLGALPTGFDPTSLGYVAAGVVLSAGILQQDLLDVSPVTRELGREAVLAELDDRVIILDDDRRIVDANRAAAAFFDGSHEEVPGESLADHCPELAATLPAESVADQYELSLEHDGEVRYYDVRVSPLYRAYGIVSGLLVSCRDVTERRQREQRLDVLNRLLRHNLRNDLNLVRGSAELLAPAVPDAEHHRIDRITETIDDLVATSDKIGHLTDALEDDRRSAIALQAEIDAVVRDARGRFPDAEIAVDCPDGVGVEAGPSLWAALRELVENACQHAGEAPSVTVRVSDDDADRQVRIDVIDDGPGIDAQEIDAVTSGEETDLRHGSGIGLWLVTWIVRTYGGTLSFAVDDSGTTVTVRLPRADVESAGSAGGSTADEPAADTATADSEPDASIEVSAGDGATVDESGDDDSTTPVSESQ